MGYSKLFSIFFLFFSFTTFAPTASLINTSHKCSQEQSEALLLFKHNLSSINYPIYDCGSYNHPIMMSWNTSTDCCKWDGVSCDNSTGDVIVLDLSCGMLQGTIHPLSSLFNLTHLTHLHLSYNSLNGTLPSWLFTSPSLQSLLLSGNMFTGDIPLKIPVNLTHLTWLDLSYNKLNGTLPSWLFSSPSLEGLDLNGNMFTGDIPLKIPVNLTHLTELDLVGNNLNGTLPSWLFTSPSLKRLDLYDNMFSGNVPFDSFALPSLTYLDLSNNNQLAGQIDVQTFPQLTNLTFLDLSYNNFSGELELSTLTNLDTLHLSYSGLSVTTKNANHLSYSGFKYLGLASCKLKVFPNSFRAMKQLRYLDLSSNEIHGQIPHWAGEIGSSSYEGLNSVNLSHNFITGLPQFQWYKLDSLYLQSNLIEGPFPPSICNMSYLVSLDMSNNSFGGLIPQCFGNISSYLRMIDMGNNSFQGTIPNIYGDCGSLEGIILNGNQLRGEVPISLSKCQSLKVVDFGNNHLNGTFPSWLGALPNLHALVLKSNNFHGHIQPSPTVDSPFPSLLVLDLSHNGFEGQLPAKYFQNFNSMKNVVKNSTKPEYLYLGNGNYYSFVVAVKGVDREIPRLFVGLTIIDLSNNYFERGIPEIIGNLSSLKVLNLSHNSLNGRIPNSLGKILEIESLDLSWNQLTGNIPQSLADLTFLEFLNLSKNHLEGSIPQGNQLRTFEENSYSGNPKLCGFPLPRKCNEYLHEVQLEADKDEEESGFTWKVVMLGYGCGTIIGLVIGYLMLSTTRPNWLNAIADAGEHMILKRRNKRRSVYMGK